MLQSLAVAGSPVGEGGMERGMEGESEGGVEGGREGEMEGESEGGVEGGVEGGREGWRGMQGATGYQMALTSGAIQGKVPTKESLVV